jgi:probable H4MPT-linked C1 transfer pathway protein
MAGERTDGRCPTLGLDIGGANLKAAHTDGTARVQPFALWKHPQALPDALRKLLGTFAPFDQLAVTMTGELCDCFATKREGVHLILDAALEVSGGRPVRVWQTDGQFVDPPGARAAPLQAAAANWLALATYAGRLAPMGPALLVDIGSTTTDLIPLQDGRPVPRAKDDYSRLLSRELVYTGVRRTPVCALLGAEGAAEWFATTLDVYVILGDLPEAADDRDTADGRPVTRAASHARLARMVCADAETMAEAERYQLALDVQARQVRLLSEAVAVVSASLPGPPATVILAGSGEFLARKGISLSSSSAVRCVSLAERLGPEISQAACAHAVAVLAREQVDGGV